MRKILLGLGFGAALVALTCFITFKLHLWPRFHRQTISFNGISAELGSKWSTGRQNSKFVVVDRIWMQWDTTLVPDSISIRPRTQCSSAEEVAKAKQAVFKLCNKPYSPNPQWFDISTQSGVISCMASFDPKMESVGLPSGFMYCIDTVDGSAVLFNGRQFVQPEVIAMLHTLKNEHQCEPKAQ